MDPEGRLSGAELKAAFRRRFGAPPLAVSWAPGRVNLIGEHIDYHDLPVLPMALTRGVGVAFKPRSDSLVRVENRDRAFEPRAFELPSGPGAEGTAGADDAESAGPAAGAGDWENYLRAAARTVAERYGVAQGMDALVGSDLPPAAGLSSSSALVVATARALLHGGDVRPDPVELAGALAEGERYVGTQGGGMDQAVSLGGRAGHALRIDFAPLRWRPVPIPEGWVVLVAHSGVTAEKSGPAQAEYNERRLGGTRALARVARELGAEGVPPPKLLAERGAAGVLAAAEVVLDPHEVARIRHVVTEAERVAQAEAALRAGDLATFGWLLTASHRSLRDDYEVSHPRLDALVEAAGAARAAGARLTGAGFGGCILAVCGAGVSDGVREALLAVGREAGTGRGPLVFVARAGPGARVD